MKLGLTSVSGTFLTNEMVTGTTSGATGYIAKVGTSLLTLSTVTGNFANSEIITGGTSLASATINNITKSLLNQTSGQILYLENKTPIMRSYDQQESFILTLSY